MKKRSLFAAVAMLIVSALVLTSATYAWFAIGGNSNITTLQGKICTSESGVTLRLNQDGAGWTTTLDYKTLRSDTTNNHFVTTWKNASNEVVNPDPTNNALTATGTYMPMSTKTPADESGIFSYTLNGVTFQANTGTKSNWYDSYQFYVATLTEDATETVDALLTIGGSAAACARAAVYTSTDGGTTWSDDPMFFSGAAEDGWKPLTAGLNPGAKDDNGNYIADSGDTSVTAGVSGAAVPCVSAASTNTNRAFSLGNVHAQNYNTNGVKNTLVKVYVWVEGQDTDCAPNNTGVPGGDIQVTWQFKLHSAQWGA